MIPLWDPVAIPPGHTLVDAHSLEDPQRLEVLAAGLQLWADETGDDHPAREWSDSEGVFAIVNDATSEIVGVSLLIDEGHDG